MTPTLPGRTALFLAPPAGAAEENAATAPRVGEEAMLRLRNPFRAEEAGPDDTGPAAADR